MFILTQSQGYIVFPLCMLDRWGEVRRGASWGRSVISFLFTLKGLLRVLGPSKHSVNAAEVERATAFAEMSRSWTVKQNQFVASAWGQCWEHHACRCSVLRTDWFLVDDTDHQMHKLSSQCLLRSALEGTESWGTRACTPSTGKGIPCRRVCLCWAEVCFQEHGGTFIADSPRDTSFLRMLSMSRPLHQGVFKTGQSTTV